MMPTKGSKDEKVRAAFEYADMFIAESERYYQRDEEEPEKGKSLFGKLMG